MLECLMKLLYLNSNMTYFWILKGHKFQYLPYDTGFFCVYLLSVY